MTRRRWIAAALVVAGAALTLLHRRLGGPLHLSVGTVAAAVPVFMALVLGGPGRTSQDRAVHGTGLYVCGALVSGIVFILARSPLAGVWVSAGGWIALLLTWPALLFASAGCALGIAPCGP